MSGLLRRIRRPGAAEENRTEPIAAPEPAHGSDAPTTAPDGERSPAPAVRADGRPLPAGVAPEDLERRAGTGRRGKVRRRARFLRRARELALRDLGGLVYEAHRREQDGGALVKEKVQQLAVLDEELRGLETELGTPRGDTVLREPGVGGTCPRCGELHASDARFCSSLRARPDGGCRRSRRPRRERARRRPPKARRHRPKRRPSPRRPKPNRHRPKRRRRSAPRPRPRRSRPSSRPPSAPTETTRPATAARRRSADTGQGRDPQAARMTEVATPPPPTERACPRCGASLAPDQEWCLSCGTAVRTRIAPTPRWRVPVVLVGTLLALIAAALILALVELSGDPQPVAKAPSSTPTATPAGAPADDGGTAAPVVGETPTPAPTAVPSVTPAPGTTPDPTQTTPPDQAEPTPDAASTTGELAEWPADKTGWTAVLASTTSRSEAEKKARAAGGGEVGVLQSDDFSSLRKGYWVVFSGQYDSRSAAETAAEGAGSGAYARRIVPR